jgi:hypothetical protein
MGWIQDYALEVQAGAALIQGAAAIVVAVLTYRLVQATREYVRLTSDLAAAARAAALAQTAASATSKARFVALVDQLRDQVAGIPLDVGSEYRLRNASLWTNDDLDTFMELGARLGFARDVTTAVLLLRRVAELVQTIKDTDPRQGAVWSSFPFRDYTDSLQGAAASLDRLAGVLRS